MLNHLNNIEFKKNVTVSLDNRISSNFDELNLYQSIFNECKKKLLNKEIKFDNISTKEKKKDDENNISTNFVVNNLLNILNSKNIQQDFYIQKNNNLKQEKKKLDQNIKLRSNIYLKNKDNVNIEKNEKKHKIFQNHEIYKNLTFLKNKHFLFYNYNTIDLSKKSHNQHIFNKFNNLNIVKNKKNCIKCSKNFIYFKNHKNNASSIFSSKNIQKNQNSIYELNYFKKINENNSFKSNKKSIFFSNLKENIQWKKAISQQVLLSISNKNNRAEIRLKPEYLGSVYITINMKDDQAKLKFISDNKEVKNFLNNCVPFLKDSLIKNGIFLKKINICSSFNSGKSTKLFISQNKIRSSNSIKQFYKNITQKKVVDMYI
ncbi:flagellar hook-length control protein FliK [Buchnera aphidicola]|uniref:Flagellar hook-length control protein-like C-terminal domain-containing protein n=1 Tax=Buchnera aphidicola (Aphis nerii) TaxID=1241835 RepID=A0A4D6XND8_9GAMM|nr:flagellar hook-length control protein FliK [Buchnera aphidicola]QCI18642.1 hypothetical protein D9V64_00395 [Buchnera aphidicola (Aphis nerii)]